VKLQTNRASYWLSLAGQAPLDYHEDISKSIGSDPRDRFACFTAYAMAPDFTPWDRFAHLKNLPAETASVRQELLRENKLLIFNEPRPDYSNNQFCLSCHLPDRQLPNKATHNVELARRALWGNQSVLLQNDSRREPGQPARIIRGIIPANYFGSGKPASTLLSPHQHAVDQWMDP
jgi:hypothetical protein